ncbi:MAG: hypothetical protein LUE17_15950, partial [Planctomycetaceae bacterium]|nr:hypothetical protein [Planctomycetaceae bacterium]
CTSSGTRGKTKMRIALFWKYIGLSVAVAAAMAASGCSNCSTPVCAVPAQPCAVVDPCTVSYRPDLYPATVSRNPEASRKTAESLKQAIEGRDKYSPAKPEKPAAAVKVEAKAEAKPAAVPPVRIAGCLVPADTPLYPAEVAPYATSEHYDAVKPEFVGEPLPPMPTFRNQYPVEPPVDTSPAQ